MDYAALIEQASEHVPSDIRVDMCRHESVTLPTFWLFRHKAQIATVAYEPNYAMPWRGTRMSRGMPTAQQRFIAMDHALRFAAS